jgi:signal transduction histidine kinase
LQGNKPAAERDLSFRAGAYTDLQQATMNIPDPDTSVRAPDDALLECIRAEVRALLSQRSSLADSEKAAAVKEKTLRVAHDIRNPLATIQAVCSSLLLETEDPERRERLQLINNQVGRLASVLSESVDRTTGPDEPPVSVNLGNLASSLVSLLQYQTDDDLVFRVQVEPGLCCRLPERDLSRSLYELLRNATDAVTGQDNPQVQLACRRADARVEIEVTDNGPGLPPNW